MLLYKEFTRILGVVNGTSNFMMTKMVEEGWSYEDALAEAQRLGFAESDPTNDVDGIDAAYKMIILSQGCWRKTRRNSPSAASSMPKEKAAATSTIRPPLCCN